MTVIIKGDVVVTKIVTIVGARPQFIKAAPVSRLLREKSSLKEVLLHTGQHYDDKMSQIFFDELELARPDYNLNIGSSSHGKQTGEMLASIEEILLQEKPSRVLIYGDTNSTLAAALAATKLHIPIAHVEAGLRLFDQRVPEEVNRLIADQLSDILFSPTDLAVKNLRREGIAESRIHQIGDVMYDVALQYGDKAEQKSSILQRLKVDKKNYVLATLHRPENVDNKQRLETIFRAMRLVSEQIPVVFPVHPRTYKMLLAFNLMDQLPSNLKLIDPLGFLDMLMLEKHASVIATDSGGVQKEAFFHRVPCVVLYETTVWEELVDLGWNRVLLPVDSGNIADALIQARSIVGCQNATPYGDGSASRRIVELL
jgi:UDP-GlcNAc3NAcA epimerase